MHFKFYKKKAEGFGYDTEGEPEIMKVSVGKQWDDVDLDEVAKSVFGQMAKRNILIIDADIFEYTKKKVSFKMKDDGISIKNRKFSYDITGAIKSEDENVNLTQMQQITNPAICTQSVVVNDTTHPHEFLSQQKQLVAVSSNGTQDISHLPSEVQAEIKQMRVQNKQVSNPPDRLRPGSTTSGTPLRYEIYDPHPDVLVQARQKGLAFTLNKKYPIFEEKAAPGSIFHGMLYVTEDDNGKRILLNDKHFVPQQNLEYVGPENSRPNHISRTAVDENAFNLGSGKVMQLPNIHTLGEGRRR